MSLKDKNALKAYKYAWERANITKILARRKIARNTPEGKLIQREYHLKKFYGLSLADYNKLLEAQGGVCAICGKPPHGKGIKDLDTDHNHTTGEVRKLLCRKCNHGLGSFDENPDRLRHAAEYLESFS
jgi:hypothetical protein